MIDLPIYDINKWNSYSPTESEGLDTTETVFNEDGTITLGRRQRVVYKEPLDLSNKVYTIYAMTKNAYQRVGVIPNSNTEIANVASHKNLYSYGVSTLTTEQQNTIHKYKIYVENGSIWHEWNNQKQKIMNTYNPSTNYYFFMYSLRIDEKILAITEEKK